MNSGGNQYQAFIPKVFTLKMNQLVLEDESELIQCKIFVRQYDFGMDKADQHRASNATTTL